MMEVIICMMLFTIVSIAAYSAINSLNSLTRRSADLISGMELAEAKIHDIRATDYPGTNNIFLAAISTTNVNNVTVDLNEAGSVLAIPGTLTAIVKPIPPWGHLVTVTVIVKEPKTTLSTTLQTVVNTYSGGRGD